MINVFILIGNLVNSFLLIRLPQIYEEFYHTINNADHEKDLRWWSNNHGVNMAMNWPLFEVCKITKQLVLLFGYFDCRKPFVIYLLDVYCIYYFFLVLP